MGSPGLAGGLVRFKNAPAGFGPVLAAVLLLVIII
jgi:hypothetical protein